MKKKQLFINAAAAVLAVGAGLLLTKYLPEGNPYPVLAEDVHDSGSCGTSATWEFDSQTGLLEIAGEGSVSSYSAGRTPWYEYRGYIKKIVVDDSITYLPASIFYDCGVLEELSIPFVGKQREINKSSSSTAYSNEFNFGYIFGTTSYSNSYGYSQPYAKYTGNLGDDNYYHFGPESTMPGSSYSQNTYYIPSSLKKLSVTDASILYYGSLMGCSSIKEVYLNDEMLRIDPYTFSSCTSLSDINIPTSLKNIGTNSFVSCTSIKYLDFASSNLSQLATSLCSSCTGLEYVDLPDGLTNIPSSIFYGCSSLKEIDIPDSVTSISNAAFSGCSSISELTLPSSLQTIGNNAFYGLSKVKKLVIPNSVQMIGSSCLFGWSSLEELSIPFVGKQREISKSSSSTAYSSDFNLGYIFGTTSYTNSYGYSQPYAKYTGNLGDDNYYHFGPESTMPTSSYSQTSFYFPKSLTKLSITDASILYFGSLMGCSYLEEVNLNDEILRIDAYSFSGCSKIHIFNFPSSLTAIGKYAFDGCSSLEEVILPDGLTMVDDYVFQNCTSLRMVEIPEGVTSIGVCAFNNCPSIIELNLPSTLETIKSTAFSNCKSVTSLLLPNNLKRIEANAFSSMIGLTEVVVPDSVTYIGSAVFQYCYNLRELSIPFVGPQREISRSSSSTAYSQNYTIGYLFGTSSYTNSYSVIGYYAQYTGIKGDDNYYHFGAGSSMPTSSYGQSTYYLPKSLKKVTVTDATVLYFGSFYGCTYIDELVLNEKLQKVDCCSFNGLGMINNSSEDFVISGNVLMRYKGASKNIVIPEGIGIIAPSAFIYPYSSFTNWTTNSTSPILSVDFTSSVFFVGPYAFQKLSSATITIPKMSGNLDISTTSFQNVSVVKYLDTMSYTNGNDTFYFSVSGNSASITKCETTSSAITLPTTLGGYTVTSVGFKGMANCTTLTSITIPSTIEELGEYAFYRCSGITTVTIPSTVIVIGDYAFADCSSLHTVTIAEGVEHIGDFAFYNCSDLFEIVVPDSVVYLGAYCFYNCTSLTSATIGISVLDINSHAFYNCTSLSTVTIGTSVRTIGDYAFYNCALTRVTTPTTLVKIGDYAFAYNRLLNKVTLRNNLETIGAGAFFNCTSLASISLPSKIDVIEDYTFAYCTSLSTFSHSGEFTSIGAFAFASTSLSSFEFDDVLTFIGEAAFKNTLLVNVYLPDAVDYIGGDAFANCKHLKTLSIPDSVSFVGTYAFVNNDNLAVTIRYVCGTVTNGMFYGSTLCSVVLEEGITVIGREVFRNCYYLNSVTLPTSLLKIGDSAFYRCFSLRSLSIKENCEEIGSKAFAYCYYLTSIQMPDTVSLIGSDAFIYNYYNTITIYAVNGSIVDYLFDGQSVYHIIIGNGVSELGERSFSNISNLIDISLSDEVETIGSLCFYGDEDLHIYIRFVDGIIDDYVFQDCNTVTRFFVESGIHTIGEHAFDSCKALQRMDLPNTVQVIGSYAFYDCNSMTYINVPVGVQIINDHVFFGCASLASIDLPNTYKSIEDYAFYGCISLRQIYISDICTKIGSYAFYNCKSLESINIKGSIKTIGDYAFRSCVLLTEIRIGDNVTSLGMCAFYDCNGLETVYLGKGIYELKDRLFYGCVNLTDLYLYAPQAYIDELAFYGAEDVTVHIGHDAYMENYFTENGINYVIDESIIYEYRIVFLDENGDVIYEGTYHYGDTVDIPDDPTKPADNTYTYAFAGWDKTVTLVNGNATYTATYTQTYIEYTVTFYDENGTVISSQTYHYGDTIVAPANPTKPADNTYTYTFNGWDSEVGTCTGNLEFTATYSRTYIEYTVTFVDENGTVISTQTYHYGDEVEVPANPSKPADNTYTYTFAGWDSAVSQTVVGNATYTATYNRTYIEYTVTFYNEDGTVISTQTYHYGDTIVAPANPTKAADNTYTYSFAGWGDEVSTCTGNMEFQAEFSRTYIEYTVTFYNEDGTVISTQTYHYGDEVEIPNNPSKAADNTYTYSFAGWDKAVTNVTGNATYTATYNRTYIEYTITFVDENGTVISTGTYHYGDEVEIPANPTKTADNTYTYSFAGWDKNVSATVTGNATYTATYSRTYIEYTVTFYNEDGTVISTATYHYGDEVEIPVNPTKASDNTYSYSFAGWDSVVTVVNGDASYTATYNRTYIEYTVTFVDENGSVISTATYHYGDEIEVPADPTKAADNTYTYSFAGWDSSVSSTVTGNATYTATYNRTYIEYTVTFVDENGSVISTATYHYGDEIEAPTNPTKSADNTYTYEFAGWDGEVGTCTGNMTFTAAYSRTYIEYTVTFYNEDGTVVATVTYHYGDEIESPLTPTKPADNTYTYSFAGWDKELGTCTGNMTFTATYSRTYIEYTVTFVDEDGTVISIQTYHYGDEVEVPADPTKAADNTYTYSFSGWDKTVVAVDGDVTYTATYSRTYIEYTVTFVDEDGTVISTQTYHYGDTIVAPENPTKPSDSTYDYTFAGWDSEVGTCTGNMTFRATYTQEYSQEYLSGQLRDQLLDEINGVTDVDLSTYGTIADIESRMSGLTDADRATVQAELDKLIQRYNDFVNSINAEFEESVSVTNKWLFGAIVSSISLLSVAAFFLRRRLPL